jgi:hypothetical protein
MKRSVRHNYRDRRHVGGRVNVTERAMQRFVSGVGSDVLGEPVLFSPDKERITGGRPSAGFGMT